MTANEMNERIGTHVYLEPVKGLQFRCRVLNAKTSYGRQRVEIEPLSGEGKTWVNAQSVKPCYPDAGTEAVNGHR